MVGGLGLVLGQNFVRLLPIFISANNKTFYLTGTERKILFGVSVQNKKKDGAALLNRRDILAKQK